MAGAKAYTYRHLEFLILEFYSTGTTNERKRAIEESLNEFAQKSDWKLCLEFVEMTNNNYLLMFLLTTLENFICTKFCKLGSDDISLINKILTTMSIKPDIPPFIRNKLMKLVIDLAKNDKNNAFSIYQTISAFLEREQSYQLRLIGLKYLQIASDEIATPRKSDEQNYLSNHFNCLLPQILDQLTEILSEYLRAQVCSGIKTPPPSPTNDDNLSSGMSSLNIVGLANTSNEICITTLKLLSHIFSYVDSFKLVTKKMKLFYLIFTCAKYHDSMSGKQIEVAVQALSAINELLYRADLSLLSTDLLVPIFNHAYELFQSLSLFIYNIDECYIDKSTEFLKLFVINYLKRAQQYSTKFTTEDLIEVLYRRTFQHNCTINSYLRCLEIWIELMELVQLPDHVFAMNLIERIVQKFSFRDDSRVVKELDTETLDENGETEWQHYLRCNIECLAKVSEFIPVQFFQFMNTFWQHGMRVLGELSTTIIMKSPLILNDVEAENCHNFLRDTASATQALARTSPNYIYNENNVDLSTIEEMVSLILDACDFIKNNQLYSAQVQPVYIVHDIVEVYSQLLASMQAWSHWIWKRPDKLKEQFCQRCINASIWALSETTCNSAPSKLIHSATHLFQSTIVIFKPNLWDQAFYRELLYRRYPSSMEKDTQQVLNKALINSLILPQGDNVLRQLLFHTFITNYMELMNITEQQMFANAQIQIPPESNIVVALVSLKQILEDCSSSSTVIKKLLLECMKPCIERTIQLLPHFMHNENTFKLLLSFLHTTIMVLQHQLGPEFIANTIKTLLELYTSEHLFRGSTLDEFLEILLCIVSSPNAFKLFIPSIINLCLVNVWPAVRSELAARQDTVLVLLRLFHSILIHRWKYFYATPILQNLCSDGQEVVEHKEELISIFEILGETLMQPDINIFQQSLKCLEQVNSKWRLYNRELFKTLLLERFVVTLMTVLVEKSQDLLTDEILITLYNMSLADTDAFYQKYLTKCIGYWSNPNECMMFQYISKDQPTFMTKMLEFVATVRRNSSKI